MKEFIDPHRDVDGVLPICKMLPIAPSTDYRHAAREADSAQRSARAQRDERPCGPIQPVWDENWQVYGTDQVWRQWWREGVAVARCTGERLMRRLGLKGVRRGQPGLSIFLCKCVWLGYNGNRPSNRMAKRLRARFQSWTGRVHFRAACSMAR